MFQTLEILSGARREKFFHDPMYAEAARLVQVSLPVLRLTTF